MSSRKRKELPLQACGVTGTQDSGNTKCWPGDRATGTRTHGRRMPGCKMGQPLGKTLWCLSPRHTASAVLVLIKRGKPTSHKTPHTDTYRHLQTPTDIYRHLQRLSSQLLKPGNSRSAGDEETGLHPDNRMLLDNKKKWAIKS